MLFPIERLEKHKKITNISLKKKNKKKKRWKPKTNKKSKIKRALQNGL